MSKPKLYQFAISPACQRVFAVLAHKGIDYDVFEVDVSKKERPAEFNRVSPFGKVPVLEHEGQTLIESSAIAQYIDEVWPQPAMMPATALGRARARRWMQYSDREILDRDAQFTHVERDLGRKRELAAAIFASLSHLDRELQGNAQLFCGPDLSLVDCMLAPTMTFLPIWSKLTDDKLYAGYKNIHAYADRLRKHPTLAKAVFGVPPELYEGFFSAVLVQGMSFP